MVHSTKKEHIDIFFIYGLSVCLIVILSLLNFVNSRLVVGRNMTTTKVEKQAKEKPLFDSTAFSNVIIEGKAYVVYDLLDNKVIASKNETAMLPLASITKVMTAVSSTSHKDKNAKITISKKSIEDSYDLGLKDNQIWSLKELLKYTLVFSSNDGAEAVADSFGSKGIFVAQMNSDAKTLGLSVVFTDPAGRDLDGNIGGKGTALDVAKLFFIARQKIPEILDATTKKRATLSTSNGKVSGIPNTNQEVEDLSGAEASKTGFTNKAGGNLGVIVDITVGHPVAIIVLGSTKEGRFKDMEVLYEALRKSVRSKSQSN